MRKNLLSLFILSSVILTGCNTSQVSGELVLEDDFQTSYELSNEYITFPSAHLEDNGEITSFDVKYTVINKNTKESKTSKYSSFKLGVGSYEFKYESNGKRIVKQFIVSDTIAPKIEFAGIPTDLYIQMIERPDRANLPSLKITDLSEINEDKTIRKLFFNDEEVPFNEVMDTYSIRGYGSYRYYVEAEDIYGNKESHSCSWFIKDNEYVPQYIEDGLIADFNELGYTNLIHTCQINDYYYVSTLHENFLEEKEDSKGIKENGVFEISGGFNIGSPYGKTASFTFDIPSSKVFQYEDLVNKYLALRVMIDNGGASSLKSSVTLFGNIPESDGFGMKPLMINKSVKVGEWNTIYIDAYNAARLGIFKDSTHDNGPDATFVNGDRTYFNTIRGDCLSLSLGVVDESSNDLNNKFHFYIDSVALANTVLSEPLLTFDDDKLSWEPVSGATGYLVNINGDASITTNNEINIPSQGTGYIKVKAISDIITKVDSEEAIYLYGLDKKDHEVALFDHEVYKELINNNLHFNKTDDFEKENYKSKNISLKIKEEEGMIMTLASSPWGIVNGCAINLPYRVNKNSGDTLVIKGKLSTDSLKTMSIYDNNTFKGAPLKSFDITGAANQMLEIKIDLTRINYDITRLEFIFGPGNSTQELEITLNSIYLERKVATPIVSISGNTLSWLEDVDATNYLIRESDNNGNVIETTTAETSYTLKSTTITASLMAKGNGSSLKDSEAVYFVQKSNVAYLAEIVSTSNMSGGYSTAALIQISNVKIPGITTSGEITTSDYSGLGYFDISALKVFKNGESSNDALNDLHYHSNVNPPILQPHFSSLVFEDVVTIKGDLSGSYFSYIYNGINQYYIFEDDINIKYDKDANNVKRLLLL